MGRSQTLDLGGTNFFPQTLPLSPHYSPSSSSSHLALFSTKKIGREGGVNVASVATGESYGLNFETKNSSPTNGRVYVSKAQGAVMNVLAKGSAIGQDALNNAKAFDEKHQLTTNASAKVFSFDI